MGLETATYITELNAANPLANDFIREADDHMRLIKSVLQNTLPNANAPILATPAELNLLIGQTAFPGAGGVDTQVQFNSSGNFAGSSNMTFDGTTLSLGGLSVDGAAVVRNPAGTTFLDIDGDGISNTEIRFQDNTVREARINYAEATNQFRFELFNKGGAASLYAIVLSPLGASITDGSSTMQWQSDQLLLDNTGDIFFEALQNETILRSGDTGSPATPDPIETILRFEDLGQNEYGRLGYDGADALDLINFAFDADLNIFVTDSVSGTSDYGITLNSQALAINLDVNGTPDTLLDFDSSGATTVTDATTQIYAPLLITSTADIVFEEKADHSRVPVAGRGQLWVRNDSPNVLVFTDDTGVDTVLGAGGGGGLPTGTVTNSILRWDGAAWVEETGFEVDVNGAIARFGAQNNYEMSNNISDTLRLTSGGSSNTISMDFGGGSNITRLITDGSGVRFSDGQNGDQIWTYNKNGANRFFNNDVETARTATLAAGGLEVNNTVTGAGFERVLTTSDLGGGGGTIGGTISNNQIAVGALVTDDIEGSATFTWDGTDMRIGNSFFRDDGGSQFRYTSNSATQSGINFHDGLAAFRGRINTNSGNMQFLTQTTTGLILNDAGTVDIYNNNVLVAQTNAQGLELYRAGGGQLSIGDAALDLQIEHDGTTGSITQFGGIGSLAIQNRVNSQFVNIGSDDSGGTFRVGAQIGGATPNVELNYNGNQRFETSNEGITVGRGTFVATSYELSVQNSTGTDTYIEILNNAGTNQGAFFGMETANDFALYNWQGGPIIFYTDTVASSGAVRMRIENDGDIALGNFVFNAQQSVGAGQDNFVLTYDDASGEISLEAAPGGGGSPGGATTNVQFNNSSSFDGDPEFVWDTVGKVLTLIDGGANGQIDLYQTATAGTVEADLDLDLLSDGTIRVHTGGEGFTISTRIDSDLPHRISAASEVQIDFADTAATAGNQNFRIINDSEQFAIQLFNDAFTVGANALAITRTANTIDQIRMFPGDMIDIPNGAGLYLADRADHFNTPAAGRGELWMRTSDDALVFTDPSGTDHDLTAAGGGNVSNSGTPVNDQLAIWVDATTIEGITNLTWNGGSNRLSLVSAGIEIDAAQRIYLDGGSNTWIQEQSADVIGFNAGGFTRMTVGSSINMDVTTITQADTSSPADNLFIMQTGANRNNRIRWTEAGVTRGQIGYVNSTDAIVVQGPVQSVQTWADEGSAILRGFSTQDVNASGTSIDLDLGNYFYKTITGATTFTFDNAKANLATHFYLELTNPSTNITWPASVDWAGGSAPTLTTTGVDILEFITRDGGTTWHGRVYSLDSQ